MGDYFLSKKQNSRKKIIDLSSRIQKNLKEVNIDNYCIYVTGSYARGEATENSDVDLFFIINDQPNNNKYSKIEKTLADAGVINALREMNFPPFSNDGQYLEAHLCSQMKSLLGGQEDDYKNLFTARMLLLLESLPVYNDNVYKEVMKIIIGTYLTDYSDHAPNFKPLFLMNDVIRYWKTLCLNYENYRQNNIDNKEKRSKILIKNMKLKFSRMLTCYSFLILLVLFSDNINPEKILKITNKSPVDRIKMAKRILEKNEDLCRHMDIILREYEWFLEASDGKHGEIDKIVLENEFRKEMNKRAAEFSDSIFMVIRSIGEENKVIKHIVI